MTKMKICGILSFLIILSACASMQISTDYDDSVSFVGLQTYNWLPGAPVNSGNPVIDSDSLLHQRIRSEINRWFENHGYSLQPQDKSDFLVSYYVVTEQKTQISVLNDYYGYPRGWGLYGGYYDYPGPGGSRTYVYEYEMGTMIIDIVNTKTHQLMWRGTAEGEVKELKTPEQKKARIAKVVHSILSNFPPQP